MAPFAGDLVASDMNLPVYDASACPENYAENDAGVRGSAIDGLFSLSCSCTFSGSEQSLPKR